MGGKPLVQQANVLALTRRPFGDDSRSAMPGPAPCVQLSCLEAHRVRTVRGLRLGVALEDQLLDEP
jgi:hypothetical protein